MIRSALAVVAPRPLGGRGRHAIPRSILAFLLFQGSLLAIYLARMPAWLRGGLFAFALLVMMPIIGSFNAYYLEVATQVGIFVALALGLNIVVGLAGLLDLGYVAFFAVGAYSWAIFGSPQANFIFGGGFPLASWWFYRLPGGRPPGGGRLRRGARTARPPPAGRLLGHRHPRLRRSHSGPGQ